MRILPEPTPETRHFWDGCNAGQLLLQHCTVCEETYFPPRPFCPRCGSREVAINRASGDAVLWSYVINHRPQPAMGSEPYAIAVVKLAEGPLMMTNIIDCPQTPDVLRLDMPVRVCFVKQSEDITLPLFAPADGQSR